MASCQHIALLLFITGLSFAQGLTYCSGSYSYSCLDDEYCCNWNQCCDYGPSFFGLWYVWLVAILILSIVCSCIGCCVRAAQRRRLQHRRVIRVNARSPRTYGTQVIITPEYTVAGAPGYAVASDSCYTYQATPTVHGPTAPPAYQVKEDPPRYQ
ncbi:uncharacterized protein [Watersipora subatra]|uniref:uncharacterized protein n=1 Tax=Watersipora subatra TaxID=2589382 RepID=UPI00355B10C0